MRWGDYPGRVRPHNPCVTELDPIADAANERAQLCCQVCCSTFDNAAGTKWDVPPCNMKENNMEAEEEVGGLESVLDFDQDEGEDEQFDVEASSSSNATNATMPPMFADNNMTSVAKSGGLRR